MTVGSELDEGEVEKIQAILINSDRRRGFGGDGAEDVGADFCDITADRGDGFYCGDRELLGGPANIVIDGEEVEETGKFIFYCGGGSWCVPI